MLFFHSTVVVATEMPACSYDPYCLGLCEWTDCPGVLQLEDTPHPTYLLVSVPPPHSPPATASSSSHSSLSVQPESTRFKFATEEELSTFAKGLVPENSTRSTSLDPRPFWSRKARRVWGSDYTKWALNTFSCYYYYDIDS